MHDLSIFAVSAPGLESIVEAELRGLGLVGAAEAGGVAWTGGIDDVMRANLHARTPTRILVRAATFRARTFHELERHASRVEWDRFIAGTRTAVLRVSCRKSRLYHEGAVAERIANAIRERTGCDTGNAGTDDFDPGDAQLFVVRLVRDDCIISADSSGDRLHRRGYRESLAKAPLRENLAAAMILASGWDGDTPLLDPMCGAGTIPIEAALIARNIAPGLAAASREARNFAFTRWPDLDAAGWQRMTGEAKRAIREHTPAPIFASDHVGGAIRAARANAERAGVARDITFDVRRVADVAPASSPGWILTNPPYGVRVGPGGGAARARAELDAAIAGRLADWSVAKLATARGPVAEPARIGFETRTGSIAIRLLIDGPARGV